MAISHELSSEIATALFAAKERSPRELNDLKEIVLEIHNTLERLTGADRRAQLRGSAVVDSHAPQAVAKKAGADVSSGSESH